MKKTLIYIILFLSGIAIGSLVFMDGGFLNKRNELNEKQYLAYNTPSEESKQDFIQSASNMLGEVIIVNGSIEEVYKNQNNQVVIYLRDNNIPVILHCTFKISDLQSLEPFKLGETINLHGIFTQLGEEMYLESCRLIYRESTAR